MTYGVLKRCGKCGKIRECSKKEKQEWCKPCRNENRQKEQVNSYIKYLYKDK